LNKIGYENYVTAFNDEIEFTATTLTPEIIKNLTI
jgi:hypothetical protein